MRWRRFSNCEENKDISVVVIRADGNKELGLGHVMRCAAIAEAIVAKGDCVLFAVSDEASKEAVERLGFNCAVLSGSYRRFSERDAELLADLASRLSASHVLVDSYAVGYAFFNRLKQLEISCTYIDDAYSFEHGFSFEPRCWRVSSVVNYGFGFELESYKKAFKGTNTSLFIGPRYAPVRSDFRNVEYMVQKDVKRVLLTSGATNPSCTLERMVESCGQYLPNAHLTIVVGALAEFDGARVKNSHYDIVRNARNMSMLMSKSDIAVSAAGSTLYELSCVGVPMIAVPVADNQVANARGVVRLDVGKAILNKSWETYELGEIIEVLCGSRIMRETYSVKARELVDGAGAKRIAESILSQI